jgi:hypothetical protein
MKRLKWKHKLSAKAGSRLSIAFFFVLGIVLVATPWERMIALHNASWQDFARRIPVGLGEALIIAQILILMVDSAAKKTVLREFAENVSLHIIGRWLPIELRDDIEGYLARDLVRKEWKIVYNISEWPDQKGFEKLHTRIEYDMENRGRSPKDYEFAFELEESFFPELGKAKILSCSGKPAVDDNRGNRFDYPQDKKIRPVYKNNSVCIYRLIRIPPGPGYHFEAESEECFKDGSSIPFFTFYPVLSAELIVNYAKAKLEVFVDLSFGDIAKDAEEEETETGKKWAFKKPMLPGQGFSVRIYKRRRSSGTESPRGMVAEEW